LAAWWLTTGICFAADGAAGVTSSGISEISVTIAPRLVTTVHAAIASQTRNQVALRYSEKMQVCLQTNADFPTYDVTLQGIEKKTSSFRTLRTSVRAGALDENRCTGDRLEIADLLKPLSNTNGSNDSTRALLVLITPSL